MSENQITASEEVVTKEPFSAKFKEWGRKRLVSLKRKPQTIALIFMLIPSLIYILGLGTMSNGVLSETTTSFKGVDWVGHAIFVNNLFSILILLLFLNTFPKRKKPNLIFAALVFVFAIIMILMDVLFYVQMAEATSQEGINVSNITYSAMNLSIIHIVFLVIAMVVFAMVPIYKKWLMKINTRKEVESNEIKGTIDIED